jgi:hypothetical protein
MWLKKYNFCVYLDDFQVSMDWVKLGVKSTAQDSAVGNILQKS